MDPSEGWGQNEGLQGAGKHKTKERWQQVTSKREHYLSYPCIVFSQEDEHPRVREAYRC